ncbi:hypothetical protein MB02_09735 [Croceicoccus estronivorus]|nr:hypothetical protein MB02_09735 [Croceicoccus estronivorus]
MEAIWHLRFQATSECPLRTSFLPVSMTSQVIDVPVTVQTPAAAPVAAGNDQMPETQPAQ